MIKIKNRIIYLLLVMICITLCLGGLSAYAYSRYQITAEGTTKIEAEGYQRSSGLTAPNGYLELVSGSWVEYDINIAVSSSYSFSINQVQLAGELGSTQISIYVDDALVKTVTFSTTNSPASKVFGGMTLPVGEHTLKLVASGTIGYRIDNLLLTNVRMNVLSNVATRIPTVNYMESTVSNAYITGGATKGEMSNDGFLAFNTNQYASYEINVVSSDLYKLTVCAGTNASSTINVYDGSGNSLCSGIIAACPPQTETGVSPYRYGKINEIGTINLSRGVSKIKIVLTGGAYIYSIGLEKVPHIVTAIGSTSIGALAFSDTNCPETAIAPLSMSTNSNYPCSGEIGLNTNNWAEYALNIGEEGSYLMTIYAGATAPASLEFSVNDIVKYTGGIAATTDYNYVMPNEIGVFDFSAGINKIKILNTDGGTHIFYFTLKRTGNVDTGSYIDAESYIDSYGSVVKLSNEGTGSVVSMTENSWLKFQTNVEHDGYYKLVVKASTTLDNAALNISSNGEPIGKINIENRGDKYYKNLCYVNLKSGGNTLVFSMASQSMKFDYFSLDYLPLATDDLEKAFVNEVNTAATDKALYNALKHYESTFGMNVDDITSGIFYKVPIFMSMIGRAYTDANEVFPALVKVAENERTNPSVTLYKESEQINTLCSGDLTLTVQASKLNQTATAIAAVYKNDMLYNVTVGEKTYSENLTMNLNGIIVDDPRNFSFKLIYVNNLTDIKPYNPYPNIYKNIYVSENGSDSNTGVENSPYKTISRAKTEIAAINDDMTGDIIVNILPGYYKLDSTEVFGVEHSGKNGYNVIFSGSSEENPPTISGGIEVTNWLPYAGGIYRAPLTGVDEVRNLYINGFAAVRARSECTFQYLWGYDDTSNATYTNDGFVTTTNHFPTTFAHPNELELVWELEWGCHRTPVKNVIREIGRTIMLMEQPYWSTTSTVEAITINPFKLYFIENAKELLDEPGEFYYDKTGGYIYYYPYSQENLTQCETYVPDTELLFKVCGESRDNKIKNIVFDNLSIKYGAWNYVSEHGLITAQSDQAFDTVNHGTTQSQRIMQPLAQFTVEKADNIKIQNCTFSSLGSSAISMVDAVTNSKITGNVIKDISGTGIIIGTWLHMDDLMDSIGGMQTCRNIDVTNNVIRRIATEYREDTAISTYYENGINICHNDIKETPYTGITVGWGWTSWKAKNCENINVSYNRVEDVMGCLNDGSHIYTLGALPDSVITHNYFSNSNSRYYGGIYLDSGSSYMQIHDNVVEDVHHWFFIQGAYGAGNVKAYNNFSNIAKYIDSGSAVYSVIEVPTVITDSNIPQDASDIMVNAGVEQEYAHLLNNAERPEWRASTVKTTPKHNYVDKDYLIEAECFTTCYNLETVLLHPRIVALNTNNWLEYDVNVEETGTYLLTVFAGRGSDYGGGPAYISIDVNDGTEVIQGQIAQTGDFSLMVPFAFGNVNLAAGINKIKIIDVSEGCHFDYFTLKKVL